MLQWCWSEHSLSHSSVTLTYCSIYLQGTLPNAWLTPVHHSKPHIISSSTKPLLILLLASKCVLSLSFVLTLRLCLFVLFHLSHYVLEFSPIQSMSSRNIWTTAYSFLHLGVKVYITLQICTKHAAPFICCNWFYLVPQFCC